jgi:integrase
MASYQYDATKGVARVHFRHEGRQLNRVEKVDSERHAQRLVALVEETLIDLERGKLILPPGVDAKTFILTGGKVQKRPQPVADLLQPGPPPVPTIGSIFETYSETLTPGSKEACSIETEEVHGRHFKRVLGADRPFDALAIDQLQRYIDKRAGEGVVRDTIRKELTTLRVVWGWAYKRRHVTTSPAWKLSDLTFPKSREKPPFQTWDQILRRVERGSLPPKQQAELWESLWLDQSQTLKCLLWVHEHADRAFLYPMFAFAAYTGARRGEIIRSERDDWDLESSSVTIRQKKADKSKSFTRRSVPIHPTLAEIMGEWFAVHPGGPWTIVRDDGSPIGGRMATKYFRGAVKGGKWKVLHGWHTFRHSLASNMASAGVDSRDINGILGHHTDEMERRYRHLCPRKQEHALNSMFSTGTSS